MGNAGNIGKSIEKDLGRAGKDASLILSGKWNNALSLPGQESGSQRYEREAKEVANAQQAAQAAITLDAENQVLVEQATLERDKKRSQQNTATARNSGRSGTIMTSPITTPLGSPGGKTILGA